MSHNGHRSSYGRHAPSARAQPARLVSSGPGTGSYWLNIFRWIAAGLAICLAIGSIAVYLMFRSVWDSISRVPLTGLGAAPPKLTSAMNVLLIGSDSRSGTNRRFGAGIKGQRSDTIIILHIVPHRGGVIALSIPRDSVVPVVSCPQDGGARGQVALPGRVEQINATFAAGGPGCLWKTVEHTTHLHLDHFVELNFTGFEKVINDVGGVSVCLPFAVSDPDSKLRLSPGRHHVWGSQALAFWRARYIGEGSDLQRIRRDQYLMVSLLQGVERSGLTASPSRILSVITDAAGSMTTDSGLNLTTMLSIADSLRHLRPGGVQFIELPTQAYRPNPNWVTWPPGDLALFRAIALDRAVHPAGTRRARLARSYGGVTGNTNVCHDRAAFGGPLGGSLVLQQRHRTRRELQMLLEHRTRGRQEDLQRLSAGQLQHPPVLLALRSAGG
jgi:LCP family protein required for cell wall assembly